MAKKAKKSRSKSRRGRRPGRRVSGFGGGIPVNTLIAVGAGAVVSKGLNGVVKNVSFINDKPIVRPLLKLGLGYLGTSWKGGGEFVQNAALGMIAEGGLDLLGVAAPNVFSKLAGEPAVSGPTMIDLDEVSGYDNIDTGVAGYEDDLMVV